MANQQLRIQMSGPGPYGFRLLGGDKDPLSVSKIRPSSKAQVAGLLEGDVILAMNSICCKGLSHAAATGLMDGANNGLTVLLLRGKTALSDAHSATEALGPEIRKMGDSEVTALAEQQSKMAAAASKSHVTNGFEPEGTFRLSAPPSGENLKQMRISRRESRSSDVQVPDILIQPPEDPSYYSREERTSTDGGRTTRIVEEVKTEKFGGSTLTKVTKQEFTSYNSSSDLSGSPAQPQYSIIRSEEQGHPVLLGSQSHDREGGSGEGLRRRDESGWTTVSSVERRGVKTQPSDAWVSAAQEPPQIRIVCQERSDQGSLKRSAQIRNQPIPAIEIQFEPGESGYVREVRTSSEVQPRVAPNSNFEIRIGNEVTFQPKLQSHSVITRTQTGFKSAQNPPPHHHHQQQQHRFLVQEENPSRFNPEQPIGEASYERDVSLNRNETRQPVRYDLTGYQEEDHVKDGIRPGLQSTSSSSHQPPRPVTQPQYASNPESQYEHSADVYQTSSELLNRARPAGPQPQPIGKLEIQYRPEIKSQNRYNAENEAHDSQFGYNPQARAAYPDSAQPNYTASAHPPKHYSPESRPKPDIQPPVTYTAEPQSQLDDDDGYIYAREIPRQPNTRSQFGHCAQTQPQPQNEVYDRSAFGSDAKQASYPPSGYGSEPRYKPGAHFQANIMPEQAGSELSEPYIKFEPTQVRQMKPEFYDDGIKPLKAANVHESSVPQKAYAPLKQYPPPEPVHSRIVPPTVSSAPAWGHEPREEYSSPAGKIRQVDKAERIEIAAMPKWIPGSKLPTKQPTYGNVLQEPPVRDFRSGEGHTPEHGGQFVDTGHGYNRPTAEGGWYEAPTGGVKSLPNFALSRVFDPTKEQSETGQHHVPDDSEQYHSLPRAAQGHARADRPYWPDEQSEWSTSGHLRGGQYDAPTSGHLPGQKNVWGPSNAGYRREVENYDDMERSHYDAIAPGMRNDPHYQQIAAPPAPPAMPPAPHMLPQVLAPVAPAPPPAPPIDPMKIYRGSSSSDRGYGFASLEERVKVAKNVAHSVLSPENRNSRGQKLFLRRRDNAHKWTTQGPDPVPEKTAEPTRNNPNTWAPHSSLQVCPSLPPPSLAPLPSLHQDNPGRTEATPGSGYSLADDMAVNSGTGGRLFAKIRAKAESTERRSVPPSGATTIRAPVGYGAEVPPSQKQHGQYPAAGAETRGSQVIPNRLQEMIKPKISTGLPNYQAVPQFPFAQDGQPRGVSSGTGLASTGLASNAAPSQGYRPIRFPGAPAFSSPPSAPPSGQPQNPYQGARFAPKQFGVKATGAKGAGYTDL